LLREVEIVRPNQVWSADITYVPLVGGFMYLVAILDWFSRYVITWELSNTLDGHFCVQALEQALGAGQPEIFNTDQGAQFTARAFTTTLELAGVRISMDGRGRVFDNIFVERLWRTVKYEDLYIKDYATVPALKTGLDTYFTFYNHERLHQSLDYRTPAEVHFGHEKSRSTIHLNFAGAVALPEFKQAITDLLDRFQQQAPAFRIRQIACRVFHLMLLWHIQFITKNLVFLANVTLPRYSLSSISPAPQSEHRQLRKPGTSFRTGLLCQS